MRESSYSRQKIGSSIVSKRKITNDSIISRRKKANHLARKEKRKEFFNPANGARTTFEIVAIPICDKAPSALVTHKSQQHTSAEQNGERTNERASKRGRERELQRWMRRNKKGAWAQLDWLLLILVAVYVSISHKNGTFRSYFPPNFLSFRLCRCRRTHTANMSAGPHIHSSGATKPRHFIILMFAFFCFFPPLPMCWLRCQMRSLGFVYTRAYSHTSNQTRFRRTQDRPRRTISSETTSYWS